MALIIDAGGLYAQADRADPAHTAVVEILKEERGPLVTSEVAVAEAEGTFLVECLTREELGVARGLARRHPDLELGLADTSLVVLARRYRSRRIITLDERAYRTVAPLQGGSFTILPADAGTDDPA